MKTSIRLSAMLFTVFCGCSREEPAGTASDPAGPREIPAAAEPEGLSIVNGADTTDDAVGFVLIHPPAADTGVWDPTGFHVIGCTGTFLKGDVFLTAGHCTDAIEYVCSDKFRGMLPDDFNGKPLCSLPSHFIDYGDPDFTRYCSKPVAQTALGRYGARDVALIKLAKALPVGIRLPARITPLSTAVALNGETTHGLGYARGITFTRYVSPTCDLKEGFFLGQTYDGIISARSDAATGSALPDVTDSGGPLYFPRAGTGSSGPKLVGDLSNGTQQSADASIDVWASICGNKAWIREKAAAFGVDVLAQRPHWEDCGESIRQDYRSVAASHQGYMQFLYTGDEARDPKIEVQRFLDGVRPDRWRKNGGDWCAMDECGGRPTVNPYFDLKMTFVDEPHDGITVRAGTWRGPSAGQLPGLDVFLRDETCPCDGTEGNVCIIPGSFDAPAKKYSFCTTETILVTRPQATQPPPAPTPYPAPPPSPRTR